MGCGLDLLVIDDAAGSNGATDIQYQIDGGTAANWFYTSGSTSVRNQKVASGLSYGTHTFKMIRNARTSFKTCVVAFKVYQPKKPVLPTTAVEICDYNVMADYVANTVATANTIATGVLRKAATKEMVYIGTWATGLDPSVAPGWYVGSSTLSDSLQYTFFGTGLEWRWQGPGASWTGIFTLTDAANPSGTNNFGGFTTGSYGDVTSFTAATGTLVTNTGASKENGVKISGLPLGWHTIKLQHTAGATSVFFEAIDIITPVHSYKSNLYTDLQNTLSVGSCSLMDSRKTSMQNGDRPSQKAWAQAVGVTGDPTTTGTSLVPMVDLSGVIKTNGGPLQISYSVSMYHSVAATLNTCRIYMDGVAVGIPKVVSSPGAGATYVFEISDIITINASPGYHKIDIYVATGASTLTLYSADRSMTVREM